MTLPFLEAFIQDFAPAQRAALERLSIDKTAALTQAEATTLLAKVVEGVAPLFSAPTFTQEILSPSKMNQSLAELKADLTALLLQAQELEQVSTKHSTIHSTMVTKLHQSILRLDEVVLTNKTRRLNPDITEVKFIDFYNARNEATTKRRAIVEQDTGQLVSFPETSSRYMTRGGELTPKVSSRTISSGVNPDATKAFLPEDAAKPDNRFVWAEILLADGTINGVHNTVTYEGALVELLVEFPQAEDVNEIKMAPFGRFPLDVIDIQWHDGTSWVTVSTTFPLTLEFDVSAVRFDPVNTLKIRMIFHQSDYIYEEFVLEQGQIKRTNFLNIMLDRTMNDQINQEPTGFHKLRDDRRNRAKLALDQALASNHDEEEVDRYTNAISQLVDIDSVTLNRISKYKYVAGLRSLAINYKRYTAMSEYRAPRLQANSSVFEFELESDETHYVNSDGYPVTAIEWDMDMGGGFTTPVLPTDSDIIIEVLKLDARLTSTTRFVEDDTNSYRVVYRDGVELVITTDYTISAAASGAKITVTIDPVSWSPDSTYYIAYRPIASQKVFDVTADRYSIKPVKPEIFTKTGNLNIVNIKAHPYILNEVMVGEYWTRPDPRDAIWQYVPPIERTSLTDTPYHVELDGDYFGAFPEDTVAEDFTTGLLIDSSTVFILVSSPTQLLIKGTEYTWQVPVYLKIEDEIIKCDVITEFYSPDKLRFQISQRGYNNTAIVDHAADTPCRLIEKAFYSPIDVKYNGNHCLNITNYVTGENPAFTNSGDIPQYIQIGASLYFDRPLTGRIEVVYNRLTDYMEVRALMYSLDVNKEHTSMVNSYALKLKTTTV